MPQFKNVQEYIRLIQRLSEVANRGKKEAKELQRAYEQLNESFRVQSKGIAGPGHRGIVRQQDLDRVKKLLSYVESLGPSFSAAASELQKLSQRMLAGTQVRAPGGQFGGILTPGAVRVPIRDIEAQLARVTGAREEFQRILSAPSAEYVLPETLEAGKREIVQRYKNLGVELANVKAKLDATNQSWSIHADVMKEVGDSLKFIKEESVRVDALTGKVKQQSRAQEVLRERLGPRRYEEFNKKVQKMGFSMDELASVSTDAVNGVSAFTFRTQEAGSVTSQATFRFDRFGRTLQDTSTRFRRFDDMIARNISKVAEWGIAVGVVFGAFNQAQQLVDAMIDLEDKMADVGIVTGQTTQEMQAFFDAVSDVARETGTDLASAMEAVRLAMQAGAGATGLGREQVGMQILEDAAVLARLSGMEMSEATDIITSSLRQMRDSFEQMEGIEDPLVGGEELLNRWVAVSKEAQVSLDAMGKGFATVSAAASSAGVDIDELTAYIATMAETTNLSAQQSANALRAMFSSIQNPSAKKALREYGITVEDIEGKLRPMPDILDDIFTSMRAGLIDESALSEIGRALGGQGARRQAQMVAFLENYSRALELTAVSTNATNDAQDAMQRKMDTTRTAIKNLGTAFKDFSQTLGTDGGVLDLITTLVKAATNLVDALNNIVDAAGPATTALAGLMATWAIGREMAIPQRMMRQGGLTGVVGMGLAKLGGGNLVAPRGGAEGAFGGLLTAQAQAAGQSLGMTAKDRLLTAAPAVGTSIGINVLSAMSGAQEWDTAGGRMAGSVVGGLVGSLAGPTGSMIGTFIGNSIGGAVVNRVKQSREISKLLEVDVEGQSLEEIQEIIRELEADIESTAETSGVFGRALAINMEWLYNADFMNLGQGMQWWIDKLDLAEPKLVRLRKEVELRNEALERQRNLLEEERRLDFGFGATERIKEEFSDISTELGPSLEAAFKERRLEIPFEFARGEIESAREMSAQLERLQNLPNQMLPIWYAFRRSVEATGGTIDDTKDKFVEMGQEISHWSDENIQFILEEALAITELEKEMESLETRQQDVTDPELRRSLQQETETIRSQLNARLSAFSTYYSELRAIRAQQQFEIPSFQDYSDLTQEEFNQILEQARELQAQFAEQLQIPPEAFDSVEEWAAFVGENFQWVGREGGKVMKQFVNMAREAQEEARSSVEESFNVRRLPDIDPSRIGEIQRANRYWIEMLARMQGMSAQEYLNQEGEAYNLILGPNNTWERIYSTNQAMLFALQDIKELEEKQLEGQWNIPAGETFWVPIQSLFYDQQAETVYPDLGPLVPPTEETARNTNDISNLTRTEISKLEKIINELRNLGVSVAPKEQWSAEGALQAIRRSEFWSSILGSPEERQRREALIGMQPLELPPEFMVALESLTTQLGLTTEEFRGLFAPEFLRGVQPSRTTAEAEYGPYLPNIMRDSVERGFRNALPEFMQRMLPSGDRMDRGGAWPAIDAEKIQQGTRQGIIQGISQSTLGADLARNIQMPPVNIKVPLPEVKGDFTIQNTVMLDGRVIQRYISRILAQSMSQSIRSRGYRRSP